MYDALEVTLKMVAVASVATAARHWYVVKFEGFALKDVPRKAGAIAIVALASTAVLFLPFFVSPVLIAITLIWFIDFKTRGDGLLSWYRGW